MKEYEYYNLIFLNQKFIEKMTDSLLRELLHAQVHMEPYYFI
jgi:hypothetical protein